MLFTPGMAIHTHLPADATRRDFIRGSLGAAALTELAPAVVRGQNLSSKLDIAVVGAGGRGAANTASASGENIVALCDLNAKNLAAAKSKFPAARTEEDFRRLFDKTNDFDAVIVSTTEHTHAFATMLALRAGKHVYCEKPLTHSVWEARQVREFAATTKLATQMGIQIHAGENYRRVVELIQGGVIGAVREAHVWVSRGWGWQTAEEAAANKDHHTPNRPAEVEPVPEGLNWDLWLGPAPERPFNSVYIPGNRWYRWWDFGSGTMSDLGSHWNDLPFWALKLRAPLAVESFGPPPHPEIAPASMTAVYEHGPREGMPACRVSWYQGMHKPAIWKENGIPQWPNGCLFIGDKGMLLADYGKFVLLPEKDFAGVTLPEKRLPRVSSHMREWVDACKGGPGTLADFQYAGWLTESNHLGSVAYRVGKRIEWDAERMEVRNAPEAAKYIRREYRKGWAL
jgi:predicted dehydrogenase